MSRTARSADSYTLLSLCTPVLYAKTVRRVRVFPSRNYIVVASLGRSYLPSPTSIDDPASRGRCFGPGAMNTFFPHTLLLPDQVPSADGVVSTRIVPSHKFNQLLVADLHHKIRHL